MTICRSRIAFLLAAGILVVPAAVRAQVRDTAASPARAVERGVAGEGRTVFFVARPSRKIVTPEPRSEGNLTGHGGAPESREREELAIPWIDQAGGPRDAGLVLSLPGATANPPAMNAREAQPGDRLLVALPPSAAGIPGSRFIVFQLGHSLPEQGQVMDPVGIVRVERRSATIPLAVAQSPITTAEPPFEATLVAKFAPVVEGAMLVPLDAPLPDVFPRRGTVPRSDSVRVLWVVSGSEVPPRPTSLLLDAGRAQGMRMRDQVTFYRGDGGRGEEVIGVALVLRVSERGSSAIVLEESQSRIAAGARGRVTAKLP